MELQFDRRDEQKKDWTLVVLGTMQTVDHGIVHPEVPAGDV